MCLVVPFPCPICCPVAIPVGDDEDDGQAAMDVCVCGTCGVAMCVLFLICIALLTMSLSAALSPNYSYP